MSGGVGYSYEIGDMGGLIPNPDPPGPDWLCELIGVDYFATVTSVGMNGVQAKDLSSLATLTKLRFLSAGFNSIADLAPLAQLTNLEILQLDNTQVRFDSFGETHEAESPVLMGHSSHGLVTAGESDESRRTVPGRYASH